MKSIVRRLPLLLLIAGLSGCDSIKSKITSLLDKAAKDTAEAPSYEGDSIRHLTAADFDEFTAVKGHVVVIDFYADWCGPCQQLAPVLESIVEQNKGKVLLGKVDVEQNKQLAASHRVRDIPDVRIFLDGKQVDSFVGMPPPVAVNQRIGTQIKKLKDLSKEPAAKDEPGEGQEKGKDKPAAGAPGDDKEPEIKPMDKDWLPPGLQRE